MEGRGGERRGGEGRGGEGRGGEGRGGEGRDKIKRVLAMIKIRSHTHIHTDITHHVPVSHTGSQQLT